MAASIAIKSTAVIESLKIIAMKRVPKAVLKRMKVPFVFANPDGEEVLVINHRYIR